MYTTKEQKAILELDRFICQRVCEIAEEIEILKNYHWKSNLIGNIMM